MNSIKVSPLSFRAQLNQLHEDALKMGTLVEQSCQLAYQGLFTREIAVSTKLKLQEQKINALCQAIETGCTKLIALYAPVLQDLRLLAALMQLVRDLERIGDYAEELGAIAVQLSSYPPHPAIEQVSLMFDRCNALITLSLVALAELNADLGLALRSKDDAIDADYQKLYRLLIQKATSFESAKPTVLLALSIRHLERMADHAVNIGRRVAYIVNGD